MKDIILKSEKLIVTNILKKTKAKMFANIKIGDILEISIPMKYAGRNGKIGYASYLTIENKTSGEIAHKSFNQLPMLLENFEFDF